MGANVVGEMPRIIQGHGCMEGMGQQIIKELLY